jgi:hypothetical protein
MFILYEVDALVLNKTKHNKTRQHLHSYLGKLTFIDDYKLCQYSVTRTVSVKHVSYIQNYCFFF